MAKEIELRRHTDNDEDVLTAEGVATAVEIGLHLRGNYKLIATSGAQRATQTAACLLAGLAEAVPGGVVVDKGLRSEREDEWRAAYRRAGAGDLASLRDADPALVEADSKVLADGLRRLFETLDDGERALAIGHSPTSEAGVLGLTGVMVEPLGKGEGVLLSQEDGAFVVTSLS